MNKSMYKGILMVAAAMAAMSSETHKTLQHNDLFSSVGPNFTKWEKKVRKHKMKKVRNFRVPVKE